MAGGESIAPFAVCAPPRPIVVLLFPYAFHVPGKDFTFMFLVLMSLVQGALTWRYAPETKNTHREGIEACFTTFKQTV